MKKLNVKQAQMSVGSGYPAPFDKPCAERRRWRLGDMAGLTQFGVNLLRLPKGAWSSQRHWHEAEDEFIYVVEGEVVLVTDAGEETLRAGECAGFRAGDANGHHLQNRSEHEAVILEIGTRNDEAESVTYPDIDLKYDGRTDRYLHRNGKPY